MDWFAGTGEKGKKPTAPKELLEGLIAVRQQAMIDFNWSLRFGRLIKIGFVFKYGGPWNYPALEFEELKTLTMALFTSRDQRAYELKHLPVDIAAALNISPTQKEQSKNLSKSMRDFFKGPMA